MKKYTFVPYELPTSLDGRFVIGQEDYQVRGATFIGMLHAYWTCYLCCAAS